MRCSVRQVRSCERSSARPTWPETVSRMSTTPTTPRSAEASRAPDPAEDVCAMWRALSREGRRRRGASFAVSAQVLSVCSPFGLHNTSKLPAAALSTGDLVEHRRKRRNDKTYRYQKKKRRELKAELIASRGGDALTADTTPPSRRSNSITVTPARRSSRSARAACPGLGAGPRPRSAIFSAQIVIVCAISLRPWRASRPSSRSVGSARRKRC